VQTVSGPIVGAFAFVGLEDQLVRTTPYWRFVLGLAIVILVLAFPDGLVGGLLKLRERRSGDGDGANATAGAAP
jgi:branched-chain amino acid transport system permease protein